MTTDSADCRDRAGRRRVVLGVSLAMVPLAVLIAWLVLAAMASAAATGGCGGG